MFTRKSKALADLSPAKHNIYLQLKRCNYVIRKLLSVLNPNAIDIEAFGNGLELREAVIYPTKNEYFIPENLINICGCTINCTGCCSCKKRDIICAEYCHWEKSAIRHFHSP